MTRCILFLIVLTGQIVWSATGVDKALDCYKLLPEGSTDFTSITGYLRQDGLKCVTVFPSDISRGLDANLSDYCPDSQQTGWTAGRGMMLGTASIGMGAATYFGTMAAIGAWGTASTGVAISSLSGIAASNASLAWLGGGAVATGGGGMAVGTAALATGVGVVVIGVAVGGAYLWHLSDTHQETLGIAYKLEKFQDPTVLERILSKGK